MALPINQQNALPLPAGGAIPIGPVVPGTGATNLGKAEAGAWTLGDVGVEDLAVVDDTAGGVPVPAVGHYSPLRVDPTFGGLLVSGMSVGSVPRPLAGSDPSGGGALTLYVQSDPFGNPFNCDINSFAMRFSIDTFIAPGNGLSVLNSPGVTKYTLQVIPTGAVTSWDVRLELSLDGANFGTILTHTNVAPGSSGVVTLAAGPGLNIRSRCAALVLGAGTNIKVYWRAGL